MKTARLIVDYDYLEKGGLFTQGQFTEEDLLEPLRWELYNIESSDYKSRTMARKTANNYAVSQYPFILLIDEDGEEFAALYAEDGPITAERINEKL